MEYFIALVPSGILVLRGKSKVGHYCWCVPLLLVSSSPRRRRQPHSRLAPLVRPRVVKFYRKGRYFMLKVAEKSVSALPSLS